MPPLEGSVGLPHGDPHDFVNLTFNLSGKTENHLRISIKEMGCIFEAFLVSYLEARQQVWLRKTATKNNWQTHQENQNLFNGVSIGIPNETRKCWSMIGYAELVTDYPLIKCK